MSYKAMISLAVALITTNIYATETPDVSHVTAEGVKAYAMFRPVVAGCENYTEDSLVLFGHGGNASYLSKWFAGELAGYPSMLEARPLGIQVLPLGVVGETVKPVNTSGVLAYLRRYASNDRQDYQSKRYGLSCMPCILLGVIPARYLKVQPGGSEAAILDEDRQQIIQHFFLTYTATVSEDTQTLIEKINALYPTDSRLDPTDFLCLCHHALTDEERDMVEAFNRSKPLLLPLSRRLYLRSFYDSLRIVWFNYWDKTSLAKKKICRSAIFGTVF